EKIDFVASHGHTVHHRPDEGITIQIGDGELMAKELGLKVVNDFRIDDVRLVGQGAPLVPLGDKLLFHEYDACLNLGGIANISFDNAENVRLAFDICPANLPLNKLAEERFKLAYDESGKLAEKGIVLTGLLQELNDLEFYQSNGPKSLGIEWLNQYFYPLINQYSKEKGEDLLATIVEHEAEQIAQIIQQNQLPKILVTGGGAYHNFLIDRIREKTKVNVIVPENQLVDFKEALVFAFLGLLRIKGRINTYSSVTGASKDSSGGKIWNPLK
ncbi:MAG: anhydro-N-acetylmuramic acid kinase, partial [Flavobacteriales bacterium]|nr:anhydro-N-acetylmuramic acid kinase [Flavobacteriales bacterium]